MDNIKRINDELAVAMDQVTLEQLQQVAQDGFKSVRNSFSSISQPMQDLASRSEWDVSLYQ